MHEDPDDAEKRDKHVEAVTSTLPVATRVEGGHLHNDLVTINRFEYNISYNRGLRRSEMTTS